MKHRTRFCYRASDAVIKHTVTACPFWNDNTTPHHHRHPRPPFRNDTASFSASRPILVVAIAIMPPLILPPDLADGRSALCSFIVNQINVNLHVHGWRGTNIERRSYQLIVASYLNSMNRINLNRMHPMLQSISSHLISARILPAQTRYLSQILRQ